MNRVSNRIICRVLSSLLTVCMFMSTTGLFAQAKEEAPKEPIWVMSWAMYLFFIALTIFFFAHSLNRAESLLNNEERKQVEDELANRAVAQKKLKKKPKAE